MLEHGANINAKNKNGLSNPFGLASQGRLAEVRRALSSTVPIGPRLVATTIIEPGGKDVDLYLHLIY